MKKIIVNQAMTPDGTIIASRHRHDFNAYNDAEGNIVCYVDGGTDYTRRGGKYTDMTIYDDDPFEVIRRFFCRFDDKKNKWTPLCKMDNEWLSKTIVYNFDNDRILENEYYVKEKVYRNIKYNYDCKFPEVHHSFDEGVYYLYSRFVDDKEKIEFIKPEENPKEGLTPLDIRIYNLYNKYAKMPFEDLNDITPFDVLNDVSKYV